MSNRKKKSNRGDVEYGELSWVRPVADEILAIERAIESNEAELVIVKLPDEYGFGWRGELRQGAAVLVCGLFADTFWHSLVALGAACLAREEVGQ